MTEKRSRFAIINLFKYAGKFKKYSILAPTFAALEVMFDILIPYLMAKIVDVGIANRDLNYMVRTGMLMVGATLISLVLGVYCAKFATISSAGFAMNLRRAVFNRLQRFAFPNIDRYTTASLVTRMTTDVQFIQQMFQMLTRMFVRAPMMMIMAVFMSLTINRELALVFLVAIPVLGSVFYFIISRAHPLFIKMLTKIDFLNRIVQENLIAIRVVKAFVRHEYENEKFEEAVTELRQAQLRAEKLVTINMPVMMIVMNSCIIAILWFGGNKIIVGEMLPGMLISFLTYTQMIMISLMLFSMVFIMFVISQASVHRVEEVLEEEPTFSDEDGDPNLTVRDGSIEFRHVDLSYAADKSNPVLSDINLSITAGEKVAIIGGTGSGKSSLVQMIPRLYEVTAGEVLVGGHNVKDYKFKPLRDAVAMVLQKNLLFSGTIADNLRWGNQEATEEEMIKACKVAQAYDFIMAFPDGYQTMLGQGGTTVSGGQKQRLCIARALMKQPKIIILDDSTSAIDTATEKKFQQAFRENYQGMTIVIIAQRLQSIQDSDKIIILDDGKVVDIGTHDELVERNLIYREVYESQQEGSLL